VSKQPNPIKTNQTMSSIQPRIAKLIAIQKIKALASNPRVAEVREKAIVHKEVSSLLPRAAKLIAIQKIKALAMSRLV
jgi:hypothetical protein